MQIPWFKTALAFICLPLLVLLAAQVNGQSLNEMESKRILLSNGWKLSPVGRMLPVGDLLLNIAVSHSGKDEQFNIVLWGAVHGLDSPCPAPVHAAFFAVEKEKD